MHMLLEKTQASSDRPVQAREGQPKKKKERKKPQSLCHTVYKVYVMQEKKIIMHTIAKTCN